MKKIYKMSGWNSEAFTEENVLNRTHWMVKALYDMIELMNIGSFSISYISGYVVVIASVNYGQFYIQRPNYSNSTPYIFFVDTDNKELFGCCSTESVKDLTSSAFTSSNEANGLRGRFIAASGTVYSRLVGGYLGIKFMDGKIIGTSDKDMTCSGSGTIQTFDTFACVLGDRKEVIASPINSVELRYTRLPIYERFTGGTTSGIVFDNTENDFNGLFFRNINTTDKMYLGALKSSDNIKIFYGGYLFIVDDANDIGLITV